MKPLSDPSIFKQQTAQIFSLNRNTSLYSQGGFSKQREYFCPDQELEPECALFCYFATLESTEEHYYCRRVNQNFYSVDYVVEGHLYFRQDKQYFIAEANDVVLLHPYNDTEMLHLPNEPLSIYGFVFNGSLLPEIFHALHLEYTCGITVKERSDFEKCCKRLLNAVKNHQTLDGRLRISGIGYELLQRLSMENNFLDTEDFAREIYVYLQKHFQDDDLSIHDLTSVFQVSQPTLNSRFFKKYNQTPFQYLKRLRMGQAARLLIETGCSIKEVALSSGFSTPQHFCADFLKFYGQTPSEYRKETKRLR